MTEDDLPMRYFDRAWTYTDSPLIGHACDTRSAVLFGKLYPEELRPDIIFS